MAVIGLGKINKKILYAFAGGLCKLLTEIILYIIEQQELISHPLILGLNSRLGMIFAIIPLIYFNKNMQKLNQNQPQNQDNSVNDRNELIYEQINDYYAIDQSSKTLVIILIIAFLDLCQKLLSFLFDDYKNFWIV